MRHQAHKLLTSATTGDRFSKLPNINLGKNDDKPITTLLL